MSFDLTICVLLYGDYPRLAERCLRSITETISEPDLQLRIGLNAVSPAVAAWVKSWVPPEAIWESAENIHKYPMMRQMFYGTRPVETEYMMWFDDDSYLEGYEIRRGGAYWLDRVRKAMQEADVIGSTYTRQLVGNQREYIASRPWYGGKTLPARHRFKFATGGWWVARMDKLRQWDYPWADLDHCGGDAMLGELVRQQGLRLRQFREGVKINADESGRESKAARRGFTQNLLGADYVAAPSDVLNRATTPHVG